MEQRKTGPSYTWAAGSYVDLFLAAAVTQILFAVSLYWLLFVDSSLVSDISPGGSALSSSNLPMLAIGIMAGVGWMMGIVLGIGFDTTPLNFKTAPFDQSLISMVAALNIAGQALMFIGIVSGDAELFRQLGLMGVTLLGTSLIMVGPLTFRFFRTRSSSLDKIGPWSYGPSFGLPVIGMMTILAWLFADSDVFFELYWTVLIDSFWGMMAFAVIFGHFHGRCNWELMDPERTHLAFKVFIALCILHIALVFANETGHISEDRVNASFSLPLVWIFLIARPDRIWKKVRDGEPHSTQMLSAHSLLLVTIVVGIYEGAFMENDTGMFYSRFLLMLGVATQAIWAAGDWLHDDHRHKPVKERRTPWPNIVSMSIAMAGIVYLFVDSASGGGELPRIELVKRLTVVFLAFGFLDYLLWMVKDAVFGYNDWQRIPMFYGDRDLEIDEEDPYGIGVAESE
jgi:hypothetical protein